MEKIGDLRRDEKISRKTVKGFTLIELIIVIAIIGILAGITSLVVMGFVNDSRREAANTYAQLTYTAMQNALIQSEVRQVSTPFNAEFLNNDNDATKTDLAYVTITAKIDVGTLMKDQILKITTYYTSDVSKPVEAKIKPSDVWDFSTGQRKSTITDPTKKEYHQASAYAFLDKYFIGNLGSEFTGTCQIYIDFVNYSVDSVVYNERTDTEITFLNLWKIKDGTADKLDISVMAGTPNIFTQKNSQKREAIHFGCYPLLDTLGEKGTDYKLAKDNHDIKASAETSETT